MKRLLAILRLPGIFALLALSTASLPVPAEVRAPTALRITAKAPPRLDAIRQLLVEGRLALAAEHLQQVVQADPGQAEAWLALATVAAAQDRPADAAAYRQHALDTAPFDDAVQAAQIVRRHPPLLAAGRLRDLLAERPGTSAVHFALGNAVAAQAQWAAAAAAYRDALALDPEQPDYLFNLAVSEDRQGRPHIAAELYRQALRAREKRPARFAAASAATRLQQLPEGPDDAHPLPAAR